MHQRILIRQAVYHKLEAHPDLKALINSRYKAVSENELPFCIVKTGSESSEPYMPGTDKRSIQVQVVLYAENESSVQDELDTLAYISEGMLDSDNTLGGACNSFEYSGCDFDVEDDGETAMLTLNYDCEYYREKFVSIDELKQVHIGIDMASPRNDPQDPPGPDGQIDAEAVIHFNQQESAEPES